MIQITFVQGVLQLLRGANLQGSWGSQVVFGGQLSTLRVGQLAPICIGMELRLLLRMGLLKGFGLGIQCLAQQVNRFVQQRTHGVWFSQQAALSWTPPFDEFGAVPAKACQSASVGSRKPMPVHTHTLFSLIYHLFVVVCLFFLCLRSDEPAPQRGFTVRDLFLHPVTVVGQVCTFDKISQARIVTQTDRRKKNTIKMVRRRAEIPQSCIKKGFSFGTI